MASASNTPRGRRATVADHLTRTRCIPASRPTVADHLSRTREVPASHPTVANHLGRTRGVPAKLRVMSAKSDARWRASIQACYSLLRPVLQSRQPTEARASKPRILETTRQHILELERALAMLLEMKNNVIQTLFDGPPPPRLSIEQYKTLFRGLYPLDAPAAAAAAACPCATPSGSQGPPGSAAAGPPSAEPDLAELASLLHDAYDASDDQPVEASPAGPPLAGGDDGGPVPAPLQEAVVMGAGGDAPETGLDMPLLEPEGRSERGPDMPLLDDESEGGAENGMEVGAESGSDGGQGSAEPDDAADAESLPDVEENLSLELPSLELSGGWGDCEAEAAPERRVAWQELERAAHSLSVPAQMEQFTKIQRSDWDLDSDMASEPAPPESHLSPFSPEMALPAFCSTPVAGDGGGTPLTPLVTPPPGAGRAKRAGSSAAAAGRRAADRCRRTLALGGR